MKVQWCMTVSYGDQSAKGREVMTPCISPLWTKTGVPQKLPANGLHIRLVTQTKNRIIDRFQAHIFDIKHNNTTVARHFHSHSDQLDSNMTIHILEYIRLPKDVQRSNSLRDSRELVWIHRLNTLIPMA